MILLKKDWQPVLPTRPETYKNSCIIGRTTQAINDVPTASRVTITLPARQAWKTVDSLSSNILTDELFGGCAHFLHS